MINVTYFFNGIMVGQICFLFFTYPNKWLIFFKTQKLFIKTSKHKNKKYIYQPAQAQAQQAQTIETLKHAQQIFNHIEHSDDVASH